MAHKSKTQRAKASANRAAKKASRVQEEAKLEATAEEEPQSAEKKAEAKPAVKKAEPKPVEKKEAKKPRKRGFLREVRSEMKRVTWPTKQDVLRWSGVVIVALVFFSVFVLVLDNFIVTPVLLGISSLA
ncbi:preprotein translocase subunit SecE [Slackia piriformis]|nr:preprotein translocase subunit SecE [Slackia piriformis]